MDDLENIFSNLELNSDDLSDSENVEKYLKEIDIAFKENETTSKWIEELQKDCGPTFDEELNKMHGILEKEDMSEDETKVIRYAIVEIIAKRCIRLELKIRQGEFQAEDAIELVKFINDHRAYYTQKDYMIGFRYVVNCMAIKGHLKELLNKKETEQISACGLKDLLKTLNEYQSFGIRPQVGVLAIKQYFAGNIMKGVCHDFQLKIARSLVEMDPENFEWRFCLYSIFRFKRSAGKTPYSPSQSEIYVITEAYEQRYAMFDARICLGYAFCLAELFKNSGRVFVPITFGEKIFKRQEEVLECIRTKVDDVLAIDPTSVRSNIDVAKIYSSILPYNHRDTAFAMVCIKRALMFHPNNSKANHRMAALLISQNRPSDALKYLQIAVENDERNIFATVDLMRVYMADIPAHKTRMEEILEDPIYKARGNYSEILLLKAVYSYLDGNSQKSVDLLIEAVTNNTKCVDSLERFHTTFKRFNWGDYDSFSETIKAIVENRLAFCQPAEKKILTTIWTSLKVPYDGRRDNFKSGRHDQKHDGFYNRSHRSGYGGSQQGSRQKSDYEEYFKNFPGGSGSYKSGGSSYGSGNKSGSGGGSQSEPEGVDYYAILGLPRSATQSDIKKQFCKLAREHHPDKNMQSSEAELLEKQELMKRINAAYAKLKSK